MHRWFWKCGILFFFAGKLHNGPFQGIFRGGPRLFWPLNCPERSEGQFWGQKSRGPLEIPREMAHYVVCPKPKKIISQIFKNQQCIGIFMSLCDQSPQFYTLCFYFFIVLIIICEENPAKYPSLAKNPPKYTTAYIVQQSNCRWHCEPPCFSS
jgi:hypothetical protein